jgi:hypothetical protein
VFREQADWTFILPSELPAKVLRHLPRKIPPRDTTYSQFGNACGAILLANWRSTFAGSSDGKMNVQSAYTLNTRYILYILTFSFPNIVHLIKYQIPRGYYVNSMNILKLFFKLFFPLPVNSFPVFVFSFFSNDRADGIATFRRFKDTAVFIFRSKQPTALVLEHGPVI